MSDGEGDPPAGHVEGLGEGVELDPHLAPAGQLEEAGRPIAEVDLGVGGIVADDDVVPGGEADRLREERARRDRRRGVVRVVEPEELRAPGDVRRHGGEIREKAVLAAERQAIGDAPVEARPDVVDGVAGVGHEDDVVVVDEGDRHIRDAFLGADQRNHLGGGIDGEAVAFSHPAGSRLPEARQPFVVGIPVIGRVTCGLPQSRDDVRRRRRVGIPDPEVDQVDAASRHLAFETVDFSEEIWRKLPDSFGFFDRYGQGETPSGAPLLAQSGLF